jgi:hypothetical protein
MSKATFENPTAIPQATLRKLQLTLGRLRKSCGLPVDVVVRLRRSSKYHGQAWMQDGVGRIDLDPTRCVACLKDTLVHEWAHLMRPKANHGPAWGAAFAKAYSAVYG